MDRINSANTTDIGGGNRGFKDENVVAGTAGTGVSADHMNATQEEILHVIEQSGLVPDAGDWTQLYAAFNIMLSANTSNADFANNLVFPEIETTTNVLAITDNANGTITVNAAQSWLWRGLVRISSDDFVLVDRSLAHAASKTYHLRWNASGTGTAMPAETYSKGRFELVDMTAAAPAETDTSYDCTYDMMLIARVVTNAANVPTITPLKNKAVMTVDLILASSSLSLSGANGALARFYPVWNFARTPTVQASMRFMAIASSADADWYCEVAGTSRYGTVASAVRDFATSLTMHVVGGC